MEQYHPASMLSSLRKGPGRPLHCGISIRPMSAQGSKPVKLRASRCFPVCPRKQTSDLRVNEHALVFGRLPFSDQWECALSLYGIRATSCVRFSPTRCARKIRRVASRVIAFERMPEARRGISRMPPIALTDAQARCRHCRGSPVVLQAVAGGCRHKPHIKQQSDEPIVHAPISRQMHGRHGISPLIELG
jgi:hypothetical protein